MGTGGERRILDLSINLPNDRRDLGLFHTDLAKLDRQRIVELTHSLIKLLLSHTERLVELPSRLIQIPDTSHSLGQNSCLALRELSGLLIDLKRRTGHVRIRTAFQDLKRSLCTASLRTAWINAELPAELLS